ncbi:MAG TPA: CesT family type III secretion system chaperone [Noviherbaspirillum sp.]|nr:CesT family type III secretion system chaperone [Noviherbaspirillum sp.]
MSYTNYCELIDGLCEMIGVADPKQFYELAELTIDDEECAILHGGQYNEDRIAIFCTYGSPPEQDADLVLQRLLEANLTLMQPGGLRFAFNPMTEEVILAGAIPMAGLSPEGLLHLLQKLARQARQWRRHYSLSTVDDYDTYDFSSVSTTTRTRSLS